MEAPRKKQRKMARDPTGALMQTYERASDVYVSGKTPWLVRLDGHKFGNMMRVRFGIPASLSRIPRG